MPSVNKKAGVINLRSAVFVLLWLLAILLLMFPKLCGGFSICSKSAVPLVLILGVAGAVVAISDAAEVRRLARVRLLGADEGEKGDPPN